MTANTSHTSVAVITGHPLNRTPSREEIAMIQVVRMDCPNEQEQYYDRCVDGKTYDYNGDARECHQCGGKGYMLGVDERDVVDLITEALVRHKLISAPE